MGFCFVPTIDDDLTATAREVLGDRMDSHGFPRVPKVSWYPVDSPMTFKNPGPQSAQPRQSSGQLLLRQRDQGKVATEILSPEALD